IDDAGRALQIVARRGVRRPQEHRPDMRGDLRGDLRGGRRRRPGTSRVRAECHGEERPFRALLPKELAQLVARELLSRRALTPEEAVAALDRLVLAFQHVDHDDAAHGLQPDLHRRVAVTRAVSWMRARKLFEFLIPTTAPSSRTPRRMRPPLVFASATSSRAKDADRFSLCSKVVPSPSLSRI